MNPAPSVIIFTVLSGLGFGYLAFLGFFSQTAGSSAFLLWALGFALAVAGLASSTFHLGNPQRALRAFTQWRSSWLSREAWAAMLTLAAFAPAALSAWLGLGWSGGFGMIGAGLAVLTVLSTSMIYTQIKAVPRWHHPSVPAVFVTAALSGGAILAQSNLVPLLCAALAGAMIWHWVSGDQSFARAGSTLGTATGLSGLGQPQVFELPHTGGNYLMHEMIYVVGRRHVTKLRGIAVLAGAVFPALLLAVAQTLPLTIAALAMHLVGVFAQRWLFFAEAEHVVGLYYGRR